jgi:hypothetical protein
MPRNRKRQLDQPPQPVPYTIVPQRHGGRRPSLHDFSVCIGKVMDAALRRHDGQSACPTSQWFGRFV